MKKCCLNCAFCIRNKNTWISNFGVDSYWDPEECELSIEEREKIKNNDVSFVGAAKKEKEKWVKEYNERIEAEDNYINSCLSSLNKENNETVFSSKQRREALSIFGNEKYPDSERLGMGKCPEAPDKDYLSCWHDFWNFQDNEPELATLKEKNKCQFFFSYDKKGKRSFKACEKERVASLDKKRFYVTNLLVILGIFASIIIYQLQKTDGEQTLSFVQNGLEHIQKQETEIKNNLTEHHSELAKQNKSIGDKIEIIKQEQNNLLNKFNENVKNLSNKITKKNKSE